MTVTKLSPFCREPAADGSTFLAGHLLPRNPPCGDLDYRPALDLLPRLGAISPASVPNSALKAGNETAASPVN
jgi:hypothetical protein